MKAKSESSVEATGLVIVPCTLREANAFIVSYHRTHKEAAGHKAVFGVAKQGRLVGVAIVGRPNSCILQKKYPLMAEVTRCCTDGTFDAASKLYANSWVVARGLGYQTLITYTLPEEGGPCLRALKQQGWRLVEDDDGQPVLFGGGSWDREARPREDKHPQQGKWRWQVSTQQPQTVMAS